MPHVTPGEARALAIAAAVRQGSSGDPRSPGYLPKSVNENFEPHRWVIDAILTAANDFAPIPMRLTCPACGELHIDEGEFATKPHHTHACQACGNVWRPAVCATVGVRFLPGFKNP